MTGAPFDAPFAVERLGEVDSTNAEVRRRAEAGATGPLWITAERQVQGRGRRGRVWESRAGDLTATLLLTLEIPPQEAAGLSFVAGLAAADVAAEFAQEEAVRLKWPNDVLVGGRKAAGVLIESGRAAGGALWIAIGVGMNLVSAPEGLERPATALSDNLRPGVLTPTPHQALERLDTHLRARLLEWRDHGRSFVVEVWSRRAEGIPGPCVARLGDGDLQGRAEGLEPDGALRLRLQDGSVRRITAGEVFFGAAAAGAG